MKKKPENPNFVVGAVPIEPDFFQEKDYKFFKRHFLKAYFNGKEMDEEEKRKFHFYFIEEGNDAECYYEEKSIGEQSLITFFV